MADTSIAAVLFRQLFSRCRCDRQWPLKRAVSSPRQYHRSCYKPKEAGCPPLRARYSSPPTPVQHHQTRPAGTYSRTESYSRSRSKKEDERSQQWRQRNDVIPQETLAESSKYEMTTAPTLALARKPRRPKRTKMLMRDFIEDSLYNPHYGYFFSQATIFNPGSQPFDFPSYRSEADFYRDLGQRYTEFEDELDEVQPNESRQLWHTPTELFRPHYAEAIARYMISNYKLTNYPYHDLIIYELGAGNGTFMLNVLDYIKRTDEDVYARTQYKIIEISGSLADLQSSALSQSPDGDEHAGKVEIINQSIFSWNRYIPSPCFFLALEVIDNFPHDVIRWEPSTESPLQGQVLIDNSGELYQTFTPDLDPVASRYLRVRDAAVSPDDLPFTHPLRWGRLKRNIRRTLPFAPNLSEPEWIPTKCMQFFDVLQRYFPGHRLLLSDFDELPDAVDKGVNAPVVQTRFKRQTIPVSTPLVHQGYFDILFPSDFRTLSLIYQAMTGRFVRTSSHADFMGRWADLAATECRNGDNPLVGWYGNQRMLWTV